MNQLQKLLSLADMLEGSTARADSVASHSIGSYVIVRDRNEGINAGEVVAADETGVVLKNARRLWHHKPKAIDQSWYEGVANSGLSSDSRVSGVVLRKVIIGNYSTTLCTDEAKQSIEAAVAHAQN